MRFKHVAIVGVGLIGGSFAMAARRLGLAQRITGVDSRESLDEALSAGVIDAAENSFGSGTLCPADLIYLAAPVCSILGFLRSHAGAIRPGALVTDAGSTKREICSTADEFIPASVSFVGGHPMAGSHRSGLASADPDLFQGAPYAVVPAGKSSPDAVDRVTEMATALGGRPEILGPAEHDHMMALISHVPQLLSTALALSAASGNDADRLNRLAGKGFSDSIRLAASQWSVWEDICRTNPDEIDFALANVIRELELLRLSIKSGDFDSLGNSFLAGNEVAQSFLKARKDGQQRAQGLTTADSEPI
jgi:prephenate dehydrogenase